MEWNSSNTNPMKQMTTLTANEHTVLPQKRDENSGNIQMNLDMYNTATKQEQRNQRLWQPNILIEPSSMSIQTSRSNEIVCKKASSQSIVVIVLSHYKNIDLR